MSRQPRTDADYTIDALLKGVRVLEALEGTRFEPVTTRRVQERTRLPYNTCMRSLRTLRLAGIVTETAAGWTLAPRYLAFCQRAINEQNAA